MPRQATSALPAGHLRHQRAHRAARLVPLGQLRSFSRRQWGVAAIAYVIALILIGGVGETLPGASIGRVVPLSWWNWVTLGLSPPLIALIAATLVPAGQPRSARVRHKVQTGVGGAVGTIAMACPVCNPLAIPIFGAAGVLSFLAPLRGAIAGASIALLALTLVLRLRTARACPLRPATPPSTTPPPVASRAEFPPAV